MKHLLKLATSTVLLAGFTHSAMADNRVPADMTESIAPGYRSGDMQSHTGKQFVWVRQIEGRDSEGRTRILFHDLQGALLPLDELAQANKLINPLRVEYKGRYHELTLQLADTMLSIDSTGMKRQPLPHGISTKVVLRGQLEVDKFEVSSNGLTLQPTETQKLARLTP